VRERSSGTPDLGWLANVPAKAMRCRSFHAVLLMGAELAGRYVMPAWPSATRVDAARSAPGDGVGQQLEAPREPAIYHKDLARNEASRVRGQEQHDRRYVLRRAYTP
jgi:hypothetical protein